MPFFHQDPVPKDLHDPAVQDAALNALLRAIKIMLSQPIAEGPFRVSARESWKQECIKQIMKGQRLEPDFFKNYLSFADGDLPGLIKKLFEIRMEGDAIKGLKDTLKIVSLNKGLTPEKKTADINKILQKSFLLKNKTGEFEYVFADVIALLGLACQIVEQTEKTKMNFFTILTSFPNFQLTNSYEEMQNFFNEYQKSYKDRKIIPKRPDNPPNT